MAQVCASTATEERTVSATKGTTDHCPVHTDSGQAERLVSTRMHEHNVYKPGWCVVVFFDIIIRL